MTSVMVDKKKNCQVMVDKMKLPIAHGANGFATSHVIEQAKEIVQPDRGPVTSLFPEIVISRSARNVLQMPGRLTRLSKSRRVADCRKRSGIKQGIPSYKSEGPRVMIRGLQNREWPKRDQPKD
jgi:hypothetical protein